MATNDGTSLTGYEAPYNQISDFQFGEVIAKQSVRSGLIELNLVRELPRRKIYCWLWADVSNTGDYFAIGQLSFFNRNSQAGSSLPVSVASASAGTSPIQASVPSVCVSGGNVVQDTIGLIVAQPQTGQPTNVIMQPLYVYGAIDKIKFDLLQVRNISTGANLGVRCWIGVISSQ